MIENAKKEYFELVVILNKGNKIKNEKTKVQFKIQNDSLFAFIENSGKLALALYINKKWRPAGYTKLSYLEEIIIKNMKYYKPDKNLTDFIKSLLFK